MMHGQKNIKLCMYLFMPRCMTVHFQVLSQFLPKVTEEMKNATAKYYQHLQNGNNTLKPKTVFSFVVLKAEGNPQKICSGLAC